MLFFVQLLNTKINATLKQGFICHFFQLLQSGVSSIEVFIVNSDHKVNGEYVFWWQWKKRLLTLVERGGAVYVS